MHKPLFMRQRFIVKDRSQVRDTEPVMYYSVVGLAAHDCYRFNMRPELAPPVGKYPWTVGAEVPLDAVDCVVTNVPLVRRNAHRTVYDHPEAGHFYVSTMFAPPSKELPYFCCGRYYATEEAAVDDFIRLCDAEDVADLPGTPADVIDGYNKDDI